MAVVGVAVSYAVYRAARRVFGDRPAGVFVGGALAAWFSIVISALSVALQLALSGTSPANIAIPTMAGVHALIGLGEALITLGALSFLYAARRDLLKLGAPQPVGGKAVIAVGVALALGLVVLSPLASAHPDGLEWVAGQQGFLDSARQPVFNLIPNYLLPGITNPAVATIAAGVVGVLIVLAVSLLVARARRRQSMRQGG
jgi:cobalt/nickel transport system permease protein